MPRSSQAELTSIIEAFPFAPRQWQGWADQGLSGPRKRGGEWSTHPAGAPGGAQGAGGWHAGQGHSLKSTETFLGSSRGKIKGDYIKSHENGRQLDLLLKPCGND